MALRSWVKCREQGRWLLSKARVQTRPRGGKQLSSSLGQSGNPKVRPKGARNCLGTQFLEALEAVFNKFGTQSYPRGRD